MSHPFDEDDQQVRLTPRHHLHTRHIAMIEEALCSLGEFGEVHLIVVQGCLRFVVTQKSYDALKWYPGKIE